MEENMLLARQKKKKRKRIIIVVALIIVVILGVLVAGRKPAAAMDEVVVNSDFVTERTLVSSVGATGSVVSSRQKNLSVDLTGIEIKEINVKVGDVVKEGDVLASFDTSDIEENLADAKEALAAANVQNANALEDARRMVDDAKRAESYSADAVAGGVEKAKNDYYAASADVNDAKDKLDELQKAEKKAKKAMDAAKKDYDKANKKKDSDPVKVESLKGLYQAAKAEYEQAKLAAEAGDEAVHSAKRILSMAQSNIDSANKDYNNTIANQASTVASAINTLENTEASTGTATSTTESQIKLYEKQLEEGVLYAPISGTVTSLGYEAGDKYTAGSIMTIQDCSSYEIEALIGEYNIADIKEGQKVIIKTDATGDEELTGKISFVSPVSTASEASASAGAEFGAQAGSQSSKYRVKISLDKQHERLRLDMTASLSIILEEHENALTVPFNAISTNADGQKIVTEKINKEDGSFDTKEIPVTVVMESNYYTEIQGEGVQSGMEILLTEEDNGLNEVQMMMEAGGF